MREQRSSTATKGTDPMYLGVGRSSAPIVAFLQNIGGSDLCRYLPADGLANGPARIDAFRKYLEHAVPTEARYGARPLVLFQRAFARISLERMEQVTRTVFPAARVELVALAERTLPYHQIGVSRPELLKLNRAYLRYRGALRQRMALDPEVQSRLR